MIFEKQFALQYSYLQFSALNRQHMQDSGALNAKCVNVRNKMKFKGKLLPIHFLETYGGLYPGTAAQSI